MICLHVVDDIQFMTSICKISHIVFHYTTMMNL